MIAQLAALCHDAPQQRALAERTGAGHEKGCGHAFAPQHVEDARRPHRIRAVVKGQRDQSAVRPGALHPVGAGQPVIARGADHAVTTMPQRARARARFGIEPHDLARAGHRDTGHWRQVLDAIGISVQGGPEARILAAQSPQCGAANAQLVEHAQLVHRADRVEHPHLMRAAMFAVSKVHGAADIVENGHRPRAACSAPCVGNGQRLGAPGGPVIGVTAQRYDRLVASDRSHGIGDNAHEPGLGRDRPCFPAHPMFVIGHYEQPVGNRCIGSQIPIGVGDWHRHRHRPAAPGKTGAKLGHKAAIIGMG